MSRVLAGVFALVLFSACTPNTMITMPSAAPNQISFIDADAFDASLENALSQQTATVTVIPGSGTTVNNIPPRLGRWLTAVARANGQVSVTEMKTQASFMVDILSEAYGQYQQTLMYQSAGLYHVVLHQKPGENTLEKIVFTNKSVSE
jgi:glucosamine 6-phosphate synthetase-like amidotransferase/phosphosugar isomerase protein